MRRMLCLFLLLSSFAAPAEDGWQPVLASMPLQTNVARLTSTNYLGVILDAFQSNHTVKALIFMPGAVDTFFWSREKKVALPPGRLSMLDAVNALTNQTGIRATFRPPLLLLHADRDSPDPIWEVNDEPTAERIRERHFVMHASYNDRDWDFLLPALKKSCGMDIRPGLSSRNSFHFYRNSFAAWNLTAWEALEVVALADRTSFTVEKQRVIFKEDERDLTVPASN